MSLIPDWFTAEGAFLKFKEMPMMHKIADSAAVCLAQVPAQKVEWLWPGYLPRGMLVLLDGDPGLGKSFLTLDIAARLSSGRPMPGEEKHRVPPQHVLLLNAEDDLSRTVQPRLTALGAELKYCHALT